MTDSSEEEMEELFPEQPSRRDATPIYLKLQPKTEAFDKFVLDEMMIARAMMKRSSNSLSCLSEKQRQRAVKLREGIAAKTSERVDQLSHAVKPMILHKENFSLDGPVKCRSILSHMVASKETDGLAGPASIVTDGPRVPMCSEGAETAAKISSEGDQAVNKSNCVNKTTQVNFGLEGWSVPPISNVVMPYGMASHMHPCGGGGANPKCTERESKKFCRVSDSAVLRRHGRATLSQAAPEVVNYFPLEENTTHKAHVISSKPIEESVFQSVVAFSKQGEYNKLNRSDQRPTASVLESKGKKLDSQEKSPHDKVSLQSGQKRSSDDFSLTSIVEGMAGN